MPQKQGERAHTADGLGRDLPDQGHMQKQSVPLLVSDRRLQERQEVP